MVTCKACGGQARKGSGGIASVLRDGKIESGRVCGSCMKSGGVVLVAAAVATCACGGKATACSGCVSKAEDKAKRGAVDAKTLAKALRDRAKAYKGSAVEYSQGLAAGLEQAADYLEKGKWES